MSSQFQWEDDNDPAECLARQFFQTVSPFAWTAYANGSWAWNSEQGWYSVPPSRRMLTMLIADAVLRGHARETAAYYADQLGELSEQPANE